MKATGSSTERTIWNYFCCKGFSPAGVAGLMGNLYAESGLNPINLQNTYEKRLGLTDAEYTAAVDSGSYSNFVRDSAGWIYLENPDYCTIQGVAARPAEPDPADVLAQEIAGKVKGSGLDPADVLNRVEKILGVA